jgi:ribonuclease-3
MKAGLAAAIEALEERLGYRFRDRTLPATALTHPSAPAARSTDYQRLEFLGDQVLGLVIAEALFDAFPRASEGELSRRRSELVRKETCAAVAVALGLPALIRMGGRASKAAAHTVNILGDVTEAVIAALYLDGGLEVARKFVLANWSDRMVQSQHARRDAKSALQEWAQARGGAPPSYLIVERTGPDHDARFVVEVSLDKAQPAIGSGRSRREAEQNAAAAVLLREGVWRKDGAA